MKKSKIKAIIPLVLLSSLAGIATPVTMFTISQIKKAQQDKPTVIGGRKVYLKETKLKQQIDLSGKLLDNGSLEINLVTTDSTKTVFDFKELTIGNITLYESEYKFIKYNKLVIYKRSLDAYKGDIVLDFSVENITGKEEVASDCCTFEVIDETNKTCQVSAKEDYNFDPNCSINIPEKVTIGSAEYTVTQVKNNGFYGCKNIKKIILPNTINKICSSAFYFCNHLSEINMPTNLTSIERAAFVSTFISNVVLPKNVSILGDSIFLNCENLSSFTFEEGSIIQNLPNSFLSGCTNLSQIILPSCVKKISDDCFKDNPLINIYINSQDLVDMDKATAEGSQIFNNSTIMLYINKNLTVNANSYIGTHFEKNSSTNADYDSYSPVEFIYTLNDDDTYTIGAYKLKSSSEDLIIPSVYNEKNVTVIDSNFKANTILKNVTIPNTIKKLSSYTFYDCQNLETVTFKNGCQITEIPEWCFNSSRKLKSINIPEGVTSIGSCAFSGCSALETVTIPSTINNIFGCAFGSCPITNLTFNTTKKFKIFSIKDFSDTRTEEVEGEIKLVASAFDPITSSKDVLIKYLGKSTVTAEEDPYNYHSWLAVNE